MVPEVPYFERIMESSPTGAELRERVPCRRLPRNTTSSILDWPKLEVGVVADGLETIAHAGSPGEAQLIKDRLGEAGIPAFIVGEQTFGLSLMQLDPLGDGIRIQVPVDAVDDALALLADEGSELADGMGADLAEAVGGGLYISPEALLDAEAGDDEPVDGPVCPQCKSDLIYPREIPMLLHIFSLLLLGLPYLLIHRRLQCRSCGHLLG
jgi:hypothetical protein